MAPGAQGDYVNSATARRRGRRTPLPPLDVALPRDNDVAREAVTDYLVATVARTVPSSDMAP